MEKQGEKYERYSYEELSAFCLQIALLLEAAVPLEEGLTIMAEDAAEEKEKAMLLYMAEGAELGDPFFKVLEDTGVFPPYIVRMARLGQQTGTLDQMMKSLSDYYEKEARLLKAVKNAATYPAMMILMLLVVLFVLFTKVMPVFSRVYEQLGASLPPAAAAAIRLGGILSGAALVLAAVTGAAAALDWRMDWKFWNVKDCLFPEREMFSISVRKGRTGELCLFLLEAAVWLKILFLVSRKAGG